MGQHELITKNHTLLKALQLELFVPGSNKFKIILKTSYDLGHQLCL